MSILASILVLISPALMRVVMICQVRMSMMAFLVGFLLRDLRLVIVVGAIDGAGVLVDRMLICFDFVLVHQLLGAWANT